MENPVSDSAGKPRIRVDELEKKNVFWVPDRYFDRLPSQIQARMSGRNQAAPFSFGWLVRVGAFASVVLLVLSLWFFTGKPDTSPEAQLAQVSPEEIATYLQDSEVTSRELIEMISQTTATTDENLFQPSDLTENDLIEELSNQEVDDLLLQ
jgi:hypothetical protein